MRTSAMLLFQRSQLGNTLHPFVISEVAAFCKKYDRVVLICFDYDCDYSVLTCYTNLEIIQVPLSRAKKNYMAMKSLLSLQGITDIHVACIKGIRFSEYVKNTAQVIMFGNAIADVANDVIKKDKETDKWIIEAYWFSGPAYAAALVRSQYPNYVKTVARAHSSEIDIVRNRSAYCMMKNYIIPRLDRICFVSEWGRQMYEKNILPLYSKLSSTDVVCRLGVEKLYDNVNPQSTDDVFRILTCSRAVKLKRLDLLAKALCCYKGNKRIQWIHIGDGPEMDTVTEIMNGTECIELVKMGSVVNSDVHKFMSTSPVDVFINVSEFEGLPVSIIEAFAYGIPCIATSAGGTSELVSTENGCLLPINISTDDLYKAILNFCNKDKAELSKMRKKAYETWKTQYDKQHNYDDFFSMLDML